MQRPCGGQGLGLTEEQHKACVLAQSRAAVWKAVGDEVQRSAGDRSHGGVEATRGTLAVTE